VRIWPLALALTSLLTGCDVTRLTYATTSGGEVVEPTYRDQTLTNLSKLLDEPGVLPSEIYLQTGVMQTNSSVTLSVTFPLSSMFAKTVSATISQTTTTPGALTS